MMKSESESYKAAGVDITETIGFTKNRSKTASTREIPINKVTVFPTNTEALFLSPAPIAGMEEPVLVSGTDGVGTKLKIAMLLNKHDTIGIDCVAMCVNDVICCGAKPLFFLDYIACGKNVPEKIASIVAGVAEGCVQADQRSSAAKRRSIPA